MKIAVEAFWLNTERLTGVGYYILRILEIINKEHPGNTFYLLYSGNTWVGPNLGENFIPVCYGKCKATFAVLFKLHKVINQLKPDIYHATFPTRVPPQKLCCPVVTTVHDLLPLHIESFKRKLIFNITTHWAWKDSCHFLSNSHYTASEMVKYKNIAKEKITVTHLAPAHKLPGWKSPGKHILFVGSLNSRKNPLFLLKVYYQLCAIVKNPPPLIFVGDYRTEASEFIKEMKNCPKNGKADWLKYVEQKELEELYSDAALFVLPSCLEGFGMPVIEAMSAGVPVMCSDIDVFREITEGGAEIVHGWDINKWARKMKYLLENISEREKLSKTEKEQAKKFNWNDCAKKTWGVYSNVVK
ncbi:MAG: glycosyltransferase family 1 protein [Bacteroidota bacterium]